MSSAFQVRGRNAAALFTLKVHRGDGMALLAMNWKKAKPPTDFVGFAIEYKEPKGDKFYPLKNRLAFPGPNGEVNPKSQPTTIAPIQKFRWIHFPRNAEIPGSFTYRVSPVFMNTLDELSYGEPQQVDIELRRDTYPGVLNVAFTRGFVSSQAFVDKYGASAIPTLLPAQAKLGLAFTPTHARANEAHAWMGFEARSAILELLDEAIADPKAQVRAILYDLNLPEIVSRLERLGSRLRILIDDDGNHGDADSAETAAATRLQASAGADHVRRQHLGKLQHNKIVVVDGPRARGALCGSTNHSWRGFYVQNNNALILRGRKPVQRFLAAFEDYWNVAGNSAAAFGQTASAQWTDLGLPSIKAQIGWSPRSSQNAVLKSIADDIASNTKSSLFFSLAFLYQTPGALQDAIKKLQRDNQVFSYGISDHKVAGLEETAGLDLQKPSGRVHVIHPEALTKDVPQPFKAEPVGGSGTRMHHKFVVIDFNKPTARVYTGSFNFSIAADTSNGENLLLIRNRRIAVSYAVEAVRLFDHYHFRVAQQDAKTARKKLQLARPPRKPGEKPWWSTDYSNARKILDRELFA